MNYIMKARLLLEKGSKVGMRGQGARNRVCKALDRSGYGTFQSAEAREVERFAHNQLKQLTVV